MTSLRSPNLWLPSRPASRQILVCQRRERCVRGANELAVELSLPDMRLHTIAPFNWRSGLPWQQLPSGSSIALQKYRKHLDVAAMPFVGALLPPVDSWTGYFKPPSLELLVQSPCPSEPEHLRDYCLGLCVMSGTFIRAIRKPGDAGPLLTVFHFK